jgi:GMP synthase-like glutamine amidotransferase
MTCPAGVRDDDAQPRGAPVRVLVLQHAPFEGPGSIALWLEAQHADVAYAQLFAGDLVPTVNDFDMLIAMGGPMSVNDEAHFPWLRAEKALVRDAVAAGIPVLGVCLGAQLIASACGARVYRNSLREIGWFPVQRVAGATPAFRFPSEMTVFHWHGETFDLPAGATLLARSEGCEHQAFQIGRTVIGLQFHLEMTAEGVTALIDNCRAELVPDRYVQTEAALRAVPTSRYLEGQRVMQDVLAYLCPH